jgi:glycosyltransferase involved in cell wall biosynthesis
MILITLPDIKDPGGVSSYYNAIIPKLNLSVSRFELGSTKMRGGLLYPLMDQIAFRKSIKSLKPALVKINPSLDLKGFIREGLLAYQTKRYNIPLLVFWHGWERSFERTVEGSLMRFFKSTYGKADGFIVLATEFKEKLEKWGINSPIMISTTNVDELLVSGFDLQNKINDLNNSDQIRILFLARLVKEKGVFETIDALNLLLDKGLNVSLTVAGDGDIRAELEKYSYQLGISSKHLRFTGDIRNLDKQNALQNHHIYCLPSYYGEGLPTSVLEAMAFAMPVITCPVGGLVDFFKDGTMGALIKPKSPEEIALAIENLVSQKDKIISIGKYNAKYSKDHFMASIIANDMMKFYKSTAPL